MTLGFTSLFVLVIVALFAAVVGWAAVGMAGSVAAVSALAVAFRLAKFVYEELYSCNAVDRFRCDFMSTQHHNMSGWEF